MHCPECGSSRKWRDGVRTRETTDDEVQRYLCRDCGYRYSDPSKALCGTNHRASKRQVCAVIQEAKNLTAETKSEDSDGLTPREATRPDNATTKGLIVQFAAWLDKEGYSKDGFYLDFLHTLVKRGANILDPESVKTVVAGLKRRDGKPWSNGAKMLAVYTYDAFARMMKISWTMPKYRQEETIPFIPEETELDQLIAGCRSKRMAAFLQTLKETFVDPSEALRIEWTDISGNIVTINHPVRHHLPRQLQVSQKLLSMLNNLPKKSEHVFPASYGTVSWAFQKLRRRMAEKLQNPRLRKIKLTTFRHWGGTMVAHYTNGNVLKVKKLLGHKSILTTMKYINMIHFKDDEFDVASATTVEEAKTILAAGYEYITEKNGIMLFRRPKRFSTL
jgi:integrase